MFERIKITFNIIFYCGKRHFPLYFFFKWYNSFSLALARSFFAWILSRKISLANISSACMDTVRKDDIILLFGVG